MEEVVEVAVEAPQESAVEQTEITSESETEAKTEEAVVQDENLPKPDEVAEKSKKESQSKFDKRIAALNRKIGEERARAEMLERQLQESKPKPEVNDGIRLEDFDFDVEKYAEAKAKLAEQNALKRYEQEQTAKAQKTKIQSLESQWQEKASRAESKYDDFDEVVGDLDPSHPVVSTIMQAENGDDVAYYLGKNMEEARRIFSLDPYSAAREIGKLEIKLQTEPPKAKLPSKAPAPITPVKGSAVVAKDPSEMSDREFAAWRRKQISQRYSR